MPPKKKTGFAAANKPKSRGAKLAMPAEVLPIGEVLTDMRKMNWSLGPKIGMGGFGEIFLAAPSGESTSPEEATHVIKIEPHSNGPLFSELAFYQRAAKAEQINEWKSSRKDINYVGVPAYIAAGSHSVINGQQWRFMVMERFGEDLESLFNQNGRIFSLPTVSSLAAHLITALEYLHDKEYVHADIKGSNLLVGTNKSKKSATNREVYLVDYGLAYRYTADGKHTQYKEDPKCAHDGTIEFTSRDAHKGAHPSRRGDMEILGYVLLQWACGKLPWEANLSNKSYVASEKQKFMEDPTKAIHTVFSDSKPLEAIISYFSDISKLGYEDVPNYNKLSSHFLKYLSSQKLNQHSTDHFDWVASKSPVKSRRLSERMYGSPFSVKNGSRGRTKSRIVNTPTLFEVSHNGEDIYDSGIFDDDTIVKPKKQRSKGNGNDLNNSQSPLIIAKTKKTIKVQRADKPSPTTATSTPSSGDVIKSKRIAAARAKATSKETTEEQLTPLPHSPIKTSKPAKRSSSTSLLSNSSDGVEIIEEAIPRKKLRSLNPWNDPYVFRFDDEAIIPHSPPSLPASPKYFNTSSTNSTINEEGTKNRTSLPIQPTEAMLEVMNRMQTNPRKKRGRPAKSKSLNPSVSNTPTPAMQKIIEKKSRTATNN